MSTSSGTGVLSDSNFIKWSVAYAVEGSLILAGNVLTMAVFWRRRRVLKRASYLLVNLAMADFMVGLSTMCFAVSVIFFHQAASTNRSLASAFARINLVCMSASILSLACIALERVFALVRPLVHRATNTRFYYYTVGLVWLTAGMLCALTLMSEKAFKVGKELGAYSSIFVYSTSLVVICISYAIIWRTLSKRPAPDIIQRRQNRKVVFTLSMVTLASLATFVPGEISLVMSQLNSRSTTDYMDYIAWILIYSNSLVNPFVYVLSMPAFRRDLLLLLHCK